MPSRQSLTVCARPRYLAIGTIRARSNLGRLIAVRVARVPVARLAIVLAAVGHCAGISIVGIDTAKDAAIMSNDIVHDDVSRPAVAGAVATASYHLTVVIGVKVLDLDGTSSVKLHNLVRGFECTSTVDIRSAARLLECAKLCKDKRLDIYK